MALYTWFCLHTVGPVRQIQMYDAIHVVTPPSSSRQRLVCCCCCSPASGCRFTYVVRG